MRLFIIDARVFLRLGLNFMNYRESVSTAADAAGRAVNSAQSGAGVLVQTWLERAAERWGRGDASAVAEAVGLCDQALACLGYGSRAAGGGEDGAGDNVAGGGGKGGEVAAAMAADRARVWLRRGQICESARTADALREAMRSHEAGLASLDEARRVRAGSGEDAGARAGAGIGAEGQEAGASIAETGATR